MPRCSSSSTGSSAIIGLPFPACIIPILRSDAPDSLETIRNFPTAVHPRSALTLAFVCGFQLSNRKNLIYRCTQCGTGAPKVQLKDRLLDPQPGLPGRLCAERGVRLAARNRQGVHPQAILDASSSFRCPRPINGLASRRYDRNCPPTVAPSMPASAPTARRLMRSLSSYATRAVSRCTART
jgi:hypothetical protein